VEQVQNVFNSFHQKLYISTKIFYKRVETLDQIRKRKIGLKIVLCWNFKCFSWNYRDDISFIGIFASQGCLC
jgi:hypothetical protein